jgi:hypothetical protein
MHRLALSCALGLLLVPACDFGRDNGVDGGRLTSIDAALPVPDADLDAPGLDAFVPPADDAWVAPGTDADLDAFRADDAPATTDDTGAVVDAASPSTDTGPDAPLVSMPCTAAGACDPFVTDSCGAGMACRGGASGGPTACAMLAATTHTIGEACTASSQCLGGSACLDFGDGLRCQQLCPMGSIGACADGFVCNGSITGGDPCIQVCRPLPERCNIYVQDCADPLDTCTFATNPETLERFTGCRPAGTRTDGQPCGGGAGSCDHGLVCINEGGTSTCHHVCDPAVDPTTCPTMQACTGTARSWMVGYCRPAM